MRWYYVLNEKPTKKKMDSSRELKLHMNKPEQQEAAEVIQLAVQVEKKWVFLVYKKYKEPDIILGKIFKLKLQIGSILMSDVPNAIHKMQFMDILKIKMPS